MDNEQATLLQGAVVLAKDWEWAALTAIAAWLVTCCCPVGEASWPEEKLIFAEGDKKTDEDPLADEELQPAPEAQESSGGQAQKFDMLCKVFLGRLLERQAAFKEWTIIDPVHDVVTMGALQRQVWAATCQKRLRQWQAELLDEQTHALGLCEALLSGASGSGASGSAS